MSLMPAAVKQGLHLGGNELGNERNSIAPREAIASRLNSRLEAIAKGMNSINLYNSIHNFLA